MLVIVLLASLLPESFRFEAAFVTLFAFTVLFVIAWVKQEWYVEKRINFNLEERDDHERD